jgi:hypothetical protein
LIARPSTGATSDIANHSIASCETAINGNQIAAAIGFAGDSLSTIGGDDLWRSFLRLQLSLAR